MSGAGAVSDGPMLGRMVVMAEILVRDANGNTLFRCEANDVPLGVQDVDPIEAHWSDMNSVIVTVDVEYAE